MMRIDEGCVNHNAVQLIDGLLKDRYDHIIYRDEGKSHEYALVTIGEIAGILKMANVMKDVLLT